LRLRKSDAAEAGAATFAADGLVITRHEAISIAANPFPMCKPGLLPKPGMRRVYMSAYGGFGLAVRPYYSSALGKLWLERGGTCVQANIRAAASSARAGMTPAALPGSGLRTMILPRWPPTSYGVASHDRAGSLAEGGSNGAS